MAKISIDDMVEAPKRTEIGIVFRDGDFYAYRKGYAPVFCRGLFSWMQNRGIYYEIRWKRGDSKKYHGVYVSEMDASVVRKKIKILSR